MSVDRGGMRFLESGALHAVAKNKKLVDRAAGFTSFQVATKRNHAASDRPQHLISVRMVGGLFSDHISIGLMQPRYFAES